MKSSGYDRPRYHHPSARDPLCQDASASSIFVVEYEDFSTLDPFLVQEIFRHRHILVTGVPHENMEFNEHGLSYLGSIYRPIEIQGEAMSLNVC